MLVCRSRSSHSDGDFEFFVYAQQWPPTVCVQADVTVRIPHANIANYLLENFNLKFAYKKIMK